MLVCCQQLRNFTVIQVVRLSNSSMYCVVQAQFYFCLTFDHLVILNPTSHPKPAQTPRGYRTFSLEAQSNAQKYIALPILIVPRCAIMLS